MNKLLVGLLLSIGISSANAENWVQVGTTNDAFHYVDKQSFVYGSQNIISGWKYVSYTNVYSYEYTRYEVHCPTQMFRIPVSTKYYPNGTVMDVSSMYSWEYAIPGSIAMATVKMMCNTKK